MQIVRNYETNSGVVSDGSGMNFSLATDVSKPKVFLSGQVIDGLSFARVMQVLHKIVSSNMIKPKKDRSSYFKWVNQQYLKELKTTKHQEENKINKQRKQVLKEIKLFREEIKNNPLVVDDKEYHKQVQKFWNWLYKVDHQAWVVLDPVVSVQSDSVFFEAFSIDESMYGRVTLPIEQLISKKKHIRGTTNIDFSSRLSEEFKRVRSYRPLNLQIGHSEVKVSTSISALTEKKIDLPDTWVEGFLQVQSASALPKTSVKLTPTLVSDLIALLEQNKSNVSPKSLIFHLEPGCFPEIELEPWGIKITEPNFIYQGEANSIRIWGRNRLKVLKEVLPFADTLDIDLLGSGLQSFWRISCKDFKLDLGLSGWSANDWASQNKFLFAPKNEDKSNERNYARVSALLKSSSGSTIEKISIEAGISREQTTNLLQQLCGEGKAMYDFHKKIYRWRELFEFTSRKSNQKTNKNLIKAQKIISSGKLQGRYTEVSEKGKKLFGSYMGTKKESMWVEFDLDGRAVKSECSCYEYKKTKLSKGPCAHLIALINGEIV